VLQALTEAGLRPHLTQASVRMTPRLEYSSQSQLKGRPAAGVQQRVEGASRLEPESATLMYLTNLEQM
jgi:hypothetical protein